MAPFWLVIYLYMGREIFLDFLSNWLQVAQKNCLTNQARLIELLYGLQPNTPGRLGRGRLCRWFWQRVGKIQRRSKSLLPQDWTRR